MLNARERAILDSTAMDVQASAPVLAGLLADGPELLRVRGITPEAIDGLVPGWNRPPWRRRVLRALRPGTPRYMRPPDFSS